MSKKTTLTGRFIVITLLCVLGMAVTFYALTSYLFGRTYSRTALSYMKDACRNASHLLRLYTEKELTQEELQQAVNPTLTIDNGFFMLLDREQNVLAYTESAAPYFAGGGVRAILEELRQQERSTEVQKEEGNTLVQLAGERTPDGFVVAGRPTRIFRSGADLFRTRLFFSMAAVLVAALFVALWLAVRTAKPAIIIMEMAERIAQGEQMTVPENLPGREMQQVAASLNHMGRAVTKAMDDLKYEKETMALILEGLSEGILAVDENGGILHENEAAWKLLGGRETPACQAVLRALTEKRGEDSWEGRWQGRSRTLFFAVSRLPRGSGGRRGTVALIRDITEQERLERTRHDYVANISHELRTPLSSIRGLGEGLRDGMVTEEKDRQRYYTIITEETNRLTRLVNDLLELSSLQSNPAAFEMETVDPNELIYDLYDRNSFLFSEKKLSFARALPEAPLPEILSNEDRLSQALTIFLDNARKYTPAGGSVTLGAERVPAGIRFFVRDTGIGMSEETREMAFERFHQAEKGRSDKGSGLGLAIAREVLQKMDITIQLESEEGKGSEFSFVAPLAEK